MLIERECLDSRGIAEDVEYRDWELELMMKLWVVNNDLKPCRKPLRTRVKTAGKQIEMIAAGGHPKVHFNMPTALTVTVSVLAMESRLISINELVGARRTCKVVLEIVVQFFDQNGLPYSHNNGTWTEC
jgi:hypothetical protein